MNENNNTQCPRHAYYELPWHMQPVYVPRCTCEPGGPCRPVRKPDCEHCDWTNGWKDSGDRGAAFAMHSQECKGR